MRRRPNHASRFEGNPKTKLQASSASDPETLQSQVTKTARKRLSLRGLEVLHGRLISVEAHIRGDRSRGVPVYRISHFDAGAGPAGGERVLGLQGAETVDVGAVALPYDVNFCRWLD